MRHHYGSCSTGWDGNRPTRATRTVCLILHGVVRRPDQGNGPGGAQTTAVITPAIAIGVARSRGRVVVIPDASAPDRNR